MSKGSGHYKSHLDFGGNRWVNWFMQLTESERKVLERTRKLSARWQKSRWIALPLLVGIVALAVSYCCYPAALTAYILSGFVTYVSIKQIDYVCKWWNGIPQYELLLKLAGENDGK